MDYSADSLHSQWNAMRSRLDNSISLNRDLICRLISRHSIWLAPLPIFFTTFFIIVITIITAILVIIPDIPWQYSILAALCIIICLFTIASVMWQRTMRRRVNSMQGGVTGMAANLIRYRRGFIRLSIIMWIIVIPTIIYTAWCNITLNGWPLTAAVIYVAVTITACCVAFAIRLRGTLRALRSLGSLGRQLADICHED